ncbi:YoaK family protein [Sphingobium sp. CCH11-B1]|uniref:YoaK family protein n=1 Tax=Sphingobium sp. CCH11-B1 TaxID=1768781 RepID=UPI00082DBE65|nr:YoaK family protein [Sphingobium sp. CCH11-B1]
MLIRQGDARDSRLDRKLAFALAAVAGGLNAAAFHEVGFFSANMTGNVSALSSLLAMGQWANGLGYLAIILAFITGAMVSTLAIGAGLRRAIVTIYARVILGEAALLALLGVSRMALDRAAGVPLLIIGLAFLMGLQNAIVTHISNARVRTTHISGMSTDIGIGLARMLDILRGKADSVDRGEIMTRLNLHAGTVLSFLLGGIAGVLAWRIVGDLCFVIAGLVLAAVAATSMQSGAQIISPNDPLD